MKSQERIKSLFTASIQAKIRVMETLTPDIALAADLLVHCLLNNHKMLICGNEGSAAQAQYFATKMIHCFEMERPSLPAIALTTDASMLTAFDKHDDIKMIFKKQVEALGACDDVLIALASSDSDNIIHAVEAAHSNGLQIIALTGKDGGVLAKMLNENDIELRVESNSKARIQETHLTLLNCFCDLIDWQLFTHNTDVSVTAVAETT